MDEEISLRWQISGKLGELLARQMKDMVYSENEARLYFHDGTKRPSPTLVSLNSSGSTTAVKKRHGVKNNVLINMLCKIRFLSDTIESKTR
jgi:hypothetical protein